MNKYLLLGCMAFTLSVYGQSAQNQPVQKADVGPYQGDTDADSEEDSQTETQDDDTIQMDEEDMEDDSNDADF